MARANGGTAMEACVSRARWLARKGETRDMARLTPRTIYTNPPACFDSTMWQREF